jgi:rhamnulose-1-phosphate aldolase
MRAHDLKLKREFREIAEVAGYLWDRGWAERNAGNISVDITGAMGKGKKKQRRAAQFVRTTSRHPGLEGCSFLVTVSGSRMRDVARSPHEFTCIIRISDTADGYEVVWGNGIREGAKPTSELPTHLVIHQRLRAKNAPQRVIVHTHPTELIALTHIAEHNDEERLNRLLWAMHPESIIVNPRGVGLVPYTLPGTEEIADATASAFDMHPVILWGKHGAVAIGQDAMEAFDIIDTLTKSAQVFFMCKNAGFVPEGLAVGELVALRKKFPG